MNRQWKNYFGRVNYSFLLLFYHLTCPKTLSARSHNKGIELRFSGGRRFQVKMEKSRKTPTDLVLLPPLETHRLRLTVLSVYSESHNGLALVQLWQRTGSTNMLKANLQSFHLPSPAHNLGIWGPWELCPQNQWVVTWRISWNKELGITGKFCFLGYKRLCICLSSWSFLIGIVLSCHSKGSQETLISSSVTAKGKLEKVDARESCPSGFGSVRTTMMKV